MGAPASPSSQAQALLARLRDTLLQSGAAPEEAARDVNALLAALRSEEILRGPEQEAEAGDGVLDAALDFLADGRLDGALEAGLDLETFAALGEDLASALETAPEGAEERRRLEGRGQAWLDVVRRPAILRRVSAAGAVPRWMDLTLRLVPGPRARLGAVELQGLESVDEEFIQGLVPWQPGVTFDPALLEKFRQALVDTNLFATIRLQPGEALDEEGMLPLTAQLAEREHRTFKASLGYNTDKGPAVCLIRDVIIR